MTVLTRATVGLAAATATAIVLAGCSGADGGEEADAVEEVPTDLELVSRPHFTGGMEVTLQTGRIVYNDDPCGEMDETDRVCNVEGTREYRLLGEPGTARLVEARMDPADGNTEWQATVTFSPESTRRLRAFREEAGDTGTAVLVMDQGGQVLVMASVPRIEGRRLTYPGLTKPEAWDLVEQIAGD